MQLLTLMLTIFLCTRAAPTVEWEQQKRPVLPASLAQDASSGGTPTMQDVPEQAYVSELLEEINRLRARLAEVEELNRDQSDTFSGEDVPPSAKTRHRFRQPDMLPVPAKMAVKAEPNHDANTARFRWLVEASTTNASLMPPAPPAPPAPPPMPPFMPAPDGYRLITTIDRLRQTIEGALSGVPLALYVPAGSALAIGGAPIVIGLIDLTLASGGEGATLDAHHASRFFEVRPGATLTLEMLTLANGKTAENKGKGGVITVDGASVAIISCHMINSTSNTDGGVMLITGDSHVLIDGCQIENSHAEDWGGVFQMESGNLTLRNGCQITNSTASRGGVFRQESGILDVYGDCWFAESHVELTGGVISLVPRGSCSFASATFINASAGRHGGVVNHNGEDATSTVLLVACRIDGAYAGRFGGVYMAAASGTCTMKDCSISNCESQGSGGVILTFADYTFVMSGCSVIDTRSADGSGGVLYARNCISVAISNTYARANSAGINGGVLRLVAGPLFVEDLLVVDPFARSGGAVHMSGGSLTMQGCSTSGGRSGKSGGILAILQGSATLMDCSMLDSKADLQGGCINIGGGDLRMMKCRLENCEAVGGGGAIVMYDGSVSLTESCSISKTRSFTINERDKILGGAILALGGTLMADDLTISDCTARAGGGVLAITSARVVLRNSRILRSIERALHLTSGELHLVNCAVERSAASAPNADGAIAYFASSAATADSGPLLIATFTTFRQHACNAPLFSSAGPFQLVLREITFVPLDGCDATSLASALATVTAKGCSETYTDKDGVEWGACSSRSEGACSAHPVARTTLPSLSCTCPLPEYVNPSAADAAFAPYSAPYLADPAGGCIVPMQMQAISVVSDEINVALSKPFEMQRTLDFTLEVYGTDEMNPASWRVLNAKSVRERSPWVKLHTEAGRTDARAIRDAYPSAIAILIPISIEAHGLRERAAPYEETLQIQVRSDIQGSARIQELGVSLTVQSRTSFAVWGELRWEPKVQRLCDPSLINSRDDGVSTVGVALHFPLTACDVDRLPVDHPLPNQRDARSFSALLGSTQAALAVPIAYAGDGVYNIYLTLSIYGNFSVTLLLADEPVGRLFGVATCPSDGRAVALPDGQCGCPAGTSLDDRNECTPCDIGFSKVVPGDAPCSACAPGSYAPTLGAAACIPCSHGDFQARAGQAACERCPARLSSAEGSTRCDVCAEGFYREDADTPATASTCQVCVNGESAS